MITRDSIRCACCGQVKLTAFYREINLKPAIICMPCESLPAVQVAEMVLLTGDSDKIRRRQSKAVRRQARNAATLIEYQRTGKRCSDCHAHKAPGDYHACAGRPGNLQSSCKACIKLRATLLRQSGGRELWINTRGAMRQANDSKHSAA